MLSVDRTKAAISGTSSAVRVGNLQLCTNVVRQGHITSEGACVSVSTADAKHSSAKEQHSREATTMAVLSHLVHRCTPPRPHWFHLQRGPIELLLHRAAGPKVQNYAAFSNQFRSICKFLRSDISRTELSSRPSLKQEVHKHTHIHKCCCSYLAAGAVAQHDSC